MEGQKTKPKAFVIMPFDESFNHVYNLFIATVLKEAGYEVYRADDICSQQNILRDIVGNIASANIVVADLTGSNPNVYYELGLAHALRRPVVLLTQNIEETPFDLRSYRIVRYSVHFAEIERAKKQLNEVVAGALTGVVPFGNPVIDFLVQAQDSDNSLIELPNGENENPEPPLQFLDYLVLVEEGMNKLTDVANNISLDTVGITTKMRETTEKLTGINKNRPNNFAKSAQMVVVNFAADLGKYASKLETHNEIYASKLSEVSTAYEYIIREQKIDTDEMKKNLIEFKTKLASMGTNALGAKASVLGLASLLAEIPKIERNYGRAADKTVRELQDFASNLDQTISMVARIQQLTDLKLLSKE